MSKFLNPIPAIFDSQGHIPKSNKPLGFSFWECWGHGLSVPFEHPAHDALSHVYKYGVDGVRIMQKYQWHVLDAKETARVMAQAQRARDLGCEVLLCVDWFNGAKNSSEYHKREVLPDDMMQRTKEIVQMFEPDVVECCNEPWYVKGGHGWNQDEYRRRLRDFVDGCDAAGYTGPIIGNQPKQSDSTREKDYWVWHQEWPGGLIEGKHVKVLHEYRSPGEIVAEYEANLVHREATGYRHAIMITEESPTGRSFSTDSAQGEDMFAAVWGYANQRRFPITHLQMYSGREHFEIGGDWRMASHLVNGLGEFSKCAEFLLEERDAPEYNDNNGEEPPTPGPGGKVKYPRQVRRMLKQLPEGIQESVYNIVKWMFNHR